MDTKHLEMWLEYNITMCVSKMKRVGNASIDLRRCYTQRNTIVNGDPLTVSI